MATDFINLATTPAGEPCVQVSTSHPYLEEMRREANRFRSLLERAFPPPLGGFFAVKKFPHDFGTYLEVCAVFEEDSPLAREWAFSLEGGAIPETWEELETLAAHTTPIG